MIFVFMWSHVYYQNLTQKYAAIKINPLNIKLKIRFINWNLKIEYNIQKRNEKQKHNGNLEIQ